ncbi:MAG: RNA polymerase subunit sigma [Sedimentibacter sp.]
MREIDNKALMAKNDKNYTDIFLKEYEFFILKTANNVIGKYVTKSDDQWSVSLSAFHEAIEAYSYEKGSFLSFSELVIKRRLFDYIKKQSKHFCEVTINPHLFESESDEDDINLKQEVMSKVAIKHDSEAKLEIEAISEILKGYGFSFFDLVNVSPKAKKTKIVCAKAILYITKNQILLNDMKRSKLLPIKVLENNLKLPRKILERHRKYIIAGAEIISGDYPVLSEYLRFIKEEQN